MTPKATPDPGDDRSGATRRRVGRLGGDLLTDLFVNPLDPGYADAAERRRLHGPPSTPRRVLSRAGTALVLLVFGFLLAVAYNDVVAGAPEAARARAELVEDVLAAREESEELERRADRLRAEVAAERDRALGEGEETERLRDLEARTGMVPVAGPGLRVTLTDAEAPADPVTGEAGENPGRVLDRDLQRLVNALWAAGAEAIAIDGQRLSSVSTIRAAGEAILVDFTPVSSPYVVEVIGPPGMRDRFAASRTAGQLQWLHEKYGMGFTIRERDMVRLPAATDPRLEHAKPSGSGGSPSPTGGD